MLMLSTPLFSMLVLDKVLSSSNLNTLLMLFLIILLALVLLSILQGARSFAMNKLGSWFENQLSSTVLSNAFDKSLLFKSSANSQSLRDLQVIKNFLVSPNITAIMDMPWALIFIIVLFVLHIKIGILAVISVTILLVFGIISDKSTKSLIEINNDQFIKSMRYIDQSLLGGDAIKAMGMKNNITSIWKNLNAHVQETQNAIIKKRVIFSEISKFCRTIVQISVTTLGAYLVIHGQFSSGAIIASSSLIGRALLPFEVAINSWKMFINCRKSYTRLQGTFLQYSNTTTINKMKLPSPEGKIEVQNLYFAHNGTKEYSLKNIQFNLLAGHSLAIIGSSASGKSTLAKLLVGILSPNIGCIRIDGSSIEDCIDGDLGKYLGYLPQEVTLFPGTIKDNIARMETNFHYEDVIMAAQIAGIHEMVLSMPQGYNTYVEHESFMLSGGQKQRIGLARAFYKKPKIIVLDEPDANLDKDGKKALITAISVAKEQNTTLVIISHENSILNCVDNILIINKGMLTSFGAKSEVIKEMQGRLNNNKNKSNDYSK